jgi:hypothetical protein
VKKGRRLIACTLGSVATLTILAALIPATRLRGPIEQLQEPSRWSGIKVRLVGDVLRGQTTGYKLLAAIAACEEMGPAALPLVPDLLEWYRRGVYEDEVVAAIRAIGEPESVKEVAAWVLKLRRKIQAKK